MIVDLFAGPGGWSEGLRMLGLDDVGLEHDPDACATRAAAEHLSIRADVAGYPAERFTGAEGLIASPPCQAFSMAGKGDGRELLPELLDAIRVGRWDARPHPDPNVWLALEVGRWVEIVRPRWVACEQVPTALPLWKAYAEVLRGWGYRTWVEVLNAADYGVPQTRQRAFLMASMDRAPLPRPTHVRGGAPRRGLRSWVTMADALGWGLGGLSSAWTLARPATTIAGDSRVWPPGHKRNAADDARLGEAEARARYGDRAGTGAIRLEVPDALVLQSFRPDYPVHGSRSSQFRQIGNAVPPLLAAHVVAALTGRGVPC